MNARWQEVYDGGSPEAERLVFQALARDIMDVQLKVKRQARAGAVQRAFHAKAGAAFGNAELRFRDDLPADLSVGFARPGAAYRTTVRFSNAAGAGQPDHKPDFRGVALRVHVSDGEAHDLLATNFPVSHARNARQFVAFAKATAGGTLGRLAGLVRLVVEFGPSEVMRMLRNVSARKREVRSYALESYWSRGAMRWGDQAVRFILRPAPGAKPAGPLPKADPGALATEFMKRLAEADIAFELCLQRYVDERATPIEDTAIEWTEERAPPVVVATLTIPSQAPDLAEGRVIDELAFNPWNTTAEFEPLGNLNRARKDVYDASAAHRLGTRWRTVEPWRNVVLGGLARRGFALLNRFVAWHKLPLDFALLNLSGYRYVLRRENLIDTERREAPPKARSVPPPIAEADRVMRAFDGRGNDLSAPEMGAIGAAFGRNLPPKYRPDLFDVPNPVEVSRQLLYRETFLPARSVNILAAAWIQFQVHDWVNHARHPLGKKDVTVPLPGGMTWKNTPGGPDESVMRIADNIGLGDDGGGEEKVLFANAASHWWDGSEVYGGDQAGAAALRERTKDGTLGAKLRLDENGHLPQNVEGMEVTGFNESWWLGLSALHTLFAREHNIVCAELKSHYPYWDDDRTYNTARLIVSALIAKIHTVEWTPAILATKAIEVGLGANWNGPPSDWLTRGALWLLDAHSLTGIPKTLPDHHAAPYCLTEDFVTVYRLHPLIPDDYRFFHHATGLPIGFADDAGRPAGTKTFDEIQGPQADDVLRAVGLRNTLYSFGIAHPGAITLHNYPRALQGFERDGERIDLSVVDLVRTRRRGVPRYNDFRTGLHKPRLKHFEEVTDNPEDVRILKSLYRDVDEIDTMVGLFAEPLPTGFGFSDTAFRVFILMASRRLQSDRFLTVDFRPEIYSPFGLDWIANNGMTSVILRHCPELSSLLPRTTSAFAPWRPIIPA